MALTSANHFTHHAASDLKARVVHLIAGNLAAWREARRRRGSLATLQRLEDWQLGGAESATTTVTRSAEAEAIDRMPSSAVKDALQSIPEDFRLAVYLADVEGFAYQEIADIMKTPVGTVMSRLHRGRRLLRELLADYARERGMTASTIPASTARKGTT